ncbi:WcbI family polysaccharide biosynthesis putative acetyltransferase [Leifsonia sp. ALI-44-B]|uniref:WcbI family polysaccharide biosynthesis putative acetyltransferase n=1 Tax=Leifsonia sp. ALI-44-B TaxID=1933776 RepID=UPI0009FB43CC|nr:WcbI family polysaccharide biosynthesis putative acetyltransferase [Leifsonia sp. ALI-44-B]
MSHDEGYRAHYDDFFGAGSVETSGSGDARPIGVIMGNCQAESLRVALGDEDVRFLRVPPVHELEADDMPLLARILARTDVFVTQPIRDDYRGLPLGSEQMRALLPTGARTTTVPVIRFAGLYPFQAIIRPPSDTSLVPPVVPYHDLRLVAEAARRAGLVDPSMGGSSMSGGANIDRGSVTESQIHAIADESIRQLRSREKAHDTVVVSDLFLKPDFSLMRTVNHPGNTVWTALAERVRARLGLADVSVTLTRELLDNIHAPRDQAVIDAWGLDAEARSTWTVGGLDIDPVELREAHLAWYAEHPDAVTAGLTRHALALSTLGLL